MDIIFFAALAFYTFFKLSKHLGKIDEDEKKQIEEKIILMKASQTKAQDIIRQQEKLVGSTATVENNNQSTVKYTAENSKILSNLSTESQSELNNILSRCNIDLPFFLDGAKSAFEMVIKSFSASDLETLKMLLSEKLYKGFEGAVNQRKLANNTLTTNLIAIDKSEITSVAMSGNIASIIVKFTSQQINYLSSKDGEIIEGSKSEIAEVTDIWTFKRDIESSNPNWVISRTGS
jgi:predicted lipid-binding transport protein (Tim44 family)